jgi:hypothetical protein
MAITVDVKPDFSRFRTATAEEIIAETGCSEQVAEAMLEHFTVLPG